MKFDMHLPFDKISEQMQQQHGLPMSLATAFEITPRVSEDLKEEYENVIGQIRASPVVNVDETSLKVDGVNYWLWVFTTAVCTLFVIRKVVAKGFGGGVGFWVWGFIGCDGLGRMAVSQIGCSVVGCICCVRWRFCRRIMWRLRSFIWV